MRNPFLCFFLSVLWSLFCGVFGGCLAVLLVKHYSYQLDHGTIVGIIVGLLVAWLMIAGIERIRGDFGSGPFGWWRRRSGPSGPNPVGGPVSDPEEALLANLDKVQETELEVANTQKIKATRANE